MGCASGGIAVLSQALMETEVAGLIGITKYLKVTFLRGTLLEALPPVESKHPNTGYVHLHESEQFDERLLASWIRQASEQPGDALL